MSKLVVIDGNSLLFRAYYATAYSGQDIMRTKDGIPTNAIFVFSGMIAGILKDLREGDGIAVAFDTGAKTFRHEELEAYKAQRKETPQDLIIQMPVAREFLKSIGITVLEIDGYEADDVAGTLAFMAAKEGYEAHLYTSDKDFLQLVNGSVKIKIIKKGLSDIRLMDKSAVFEEMGVYPAQITDYKGLCGDTSDNLPGVPGIGPKTAGKLLAEYGNLENIIAHCTEIPGKAGENIHANKDVALKTKRLATILLDVPLNISMEPLIYKGYSLEEVSVFSRKYELRSLLVKLPAKLKLDETAKKSFSFETVARIPQDGNPSYISITADLETSNYWRSVIYGFAVCLNNRCYYLKAEDFAKDGYLSSLLKDKNVRIYTYDYKKTKIALYRLNISINEVYFDAMLACYLLDVSASLTPLEAFALFNDEIHYQAALKLSREEETESVVRMAYYSYVSEPKMMAQLNEKKIVRILKDIEQPLSTVLAKMETEGLPLDVGMLAGFGKTFLGKKEALTKEIYLLADEEFNISSPKQVAVILFDKLGLPRSNKDSTSIEVLRFLIDRHPIVGKLIEHRKYSKMLSTYIESIGEHVFPDQKLHTIFNQAVTTTGRLSTSEPNLQNIAVKDEESKMIRQAFYYPDEDIDLVSLDYSQIELRVLASLSNCRALIDVFNENRDIHDETAKRIFGQATPAARRMAKAVNFGIIYGISDWGLSEQIGTNPASARQIITKFFDNYPEVREYMQSLVGKLVADGYVSTLTGRRRYLQEISSANYQTREFAKRAAMNAPIQGTAADLIKIAMIGIDRMLAESGYRAKMILQVHDELIFRVPKDEIGEVVPKIKFIMENAMSLNVKLIAEVNTGHSWYDL